MSDQITTAIERAEAAIYEAVWGGPRDEDRHPDAEEYQDARTVLAAALDAEEIARALFVWNTPQNPYFVLQGRPDGSDEAGQAEDPYLPVARAIRAAILGGAA